MEFNLHRLYLLIRRDLTSHFRWIIGAILIFVFIFFLITAAGHNFLRISTGGAMNPIMICFFGALFILGPLFTASSMGHFATTQKRLNNLLVPASTFEKVLRRWFYTFPLFVIILGAIFYVFFTSYVGMYGHYFDEMTANVAEKLRSKMVPYFVLLYGVGHSVALFFAHYFNRHAAIKGGLISIAAFMLIGIVRLLFELSSHSDLSAWSIFEIAIFKNMQFIGDNPFRLIWIAPVFWILTLVVARRKEV